MSRSTLMSLVGLGIVLATALSSPSTASAVALAPPGCVPQDEEKCGVEAGCIFCSGTLCTNENGGTLQTCTWACAGARCP